MLSKQLSNLLKVHFHCSEVALYCHYQHFVSSCNQTGVLQWKPVPMSVMVLPVPIPHLITQKSTVRLLAPFIKLSTHRILNQTFKYSRHYLKIRKQTFASLHMQDSMKEKSLPYVHLCHLTHYLGPFQQTFSPPCYYGSGYESLYVLLPPVCFRHHWKLTSDWKEQLNFY